MINNADECLAESNCAGMETWITEDEAAETLRMELVR